MTFGVCCTGLWSTRAEADLAVTREDMQTLKNDWLTDNVGVT